MSAWQGLAHQPAVRVPYLDAGDLPDEARPLLARPINLFRGLANSVGALGVHHRFGEWIRWECTLDPRLRELVILLVGRLAKSPYEYSHHIALGRQFGVTDEDLRGLAAYTRSGDDSAFTPDVAAALAATAEITVCGEVDDATWGRLTEHFGTEHLTDIVVVASFYAYVVRVLGALRLEVEPEYAGHLDEFPLD